MKKLQIEKITDYDISKKPADGNIGVYLSNEENTPHIHLFEVERRTGRNFTFSAPKICSDILKAYLPEKQLYEVDWTYTTGGAHTDFSFKTTHGEISGIHFTNAFPTNIRTPLSIDRCSEFFSHPQTGCAQNEPKSIWHSGPLDLMIVPIPKHKEKFIVLRDPYMSADHQTILANPNKFIHAWLTQSFMNANVNDLNGLTAEYAKNARFMSGDDNPIAPLHSSVEESLTHLRPEGWYPHESAMISYQPARSGGKINFTNGRHRTINFFNAGAPFLPFFMYKGERTDKFAEEFEWQGPRPEDNM